MDEYHIIKEIEANPSHTQRSLAQKLNISLGKVNYLLSGLVEKGLIRAQKLKQSPDKIRWHYLLTPTGMKNKIQITKEYLRRRIDEFEKLQREIEEIKNEISHS